MRIQYAVSCRLVFLRGKNLLKLPCIVTVPVNDIVLQPAPSFVLRKNSAFLIGRCTVFLDKFFDKLDSVQVVLKVRSDAVNIRFDTVIAGVLLPVLLYRYRSLKFGPRLSIFSNRAACIASAL